jgi:hypothetical protein
MKQKVTLWIDTEQGKPECIRTIRFISKLVTGDEMKHPQNFHFISLRQFNYKQRIELTEYAINSIENLSFVVIDGIRDFVSSINDEREATFIVEKLLKWTQEKNIHILTILHQNKGDTNARGHLGTELVNKAETVAVLTKPDNTAIRLTVVEPEYTRHKEFEPFAYSIDEDGNILNEDAIQGYQPQKPKADELTHFQIETLLRNTFVNGNTLTYTPLRNMLKSVLKSDLEIEFGDGKCKELITFLKEKHYINHNERLKVYSANLPPK